MPQELVINDLFREITGKFPKEICLQVEKDGVWEKYTYAKTEELSSKVAAFLISEGIEKGDFVILMLDNCPEWTISYLGILHSGACAVPIDTKATIKELENITKDCSPKAIFISHDIVSRDNFENIKQAFKKIVVIDSDIKEGNIDKLPPLYRGDTVFIPAIPASSTQNRIDTQFSESNLVFIYGAVGAPGNISMPSNLSLIQAL